MLSWKFRYKTDKGWESLPRCTLIGMWNRDTHQVRPLTPTEKQAFITEFQADCQRRAKKNPKQFLGELEEDIREIEDTPENWAAHGYHLK